MSTRTRRAQYDDFLRAAYKITCRDCTIVGFEFETPERQQQFHYALMEHAMENYLFYDGNGTRATVVATKEQGTAFRSIAESFDGREIKIFLDEPI